MAATEEKGRVTFETEKICQRMAVRSEAMSKIDAAVSLAQGRAVDVLDAVHDYAPPHIVQECEAGKLYEHYGQCVAALREIAGMGEKQGQLAAAALLHGYQKD